MSRSIPVPGEVRGVPLARLRSGRTVAASRAVVQRLMIPTEANFRGNVFGGALLSEVDRVAYIASRRHCGHDVVTASFDRVDFLAPVHVGEVVEFRARITGVGGTSMEVLVEIRAQSANGGPRRRVGHAYVTMVGVDERGRPVEVPRLLLRSAEDRRLYAEALRRMESRRRTRPLVTADGRRKARGAPKEAR